MASTKQSLHDRVEQLTDEQARVVLDWLSSLPPAGAPKQELTREEILRRAADLPGIRVPDPNAPPFEKFEPIKTRGMPASEMLIRDRR